MYFNPLKLSGPIRNTCFNILKLCLLLTECIYLFRIVTCLLKAKTVKAEKQPFLCNGLYTNSRGTRHILCDVKQQ
jgi:hypothetical protein